MMIRSFIGIPLPQYVRKNIFNSIHLNNDFKITRPENLHITLLFLGDVSEDKIVEITNRLNTIVNESGRFNIEISEFRQFPKFGYPKIVYVSGENGKTELISLSKEVRKKMKDIGFYDNKDFKYHITVARSKRYNSNQFNIPIISEKMTFDIDKIILYKSDLTSQYPIYSPLWIGNFIR